MKVRSKLIVSFCIMVILPIILCVAVVSGIFQVQTKSINDAYGVECDTFLTGFYSSTAIMGQINERIYENVGEVAKSNPEKFDDEQYLQDLSSRLDKKLSSIVVTKNGDLTYTSDKWSSEEISEMIPYFNNDDIRHMEPARISVYPASCRGRFSADACDARIAPDAVEKRKMEPKP